MSRVVGKYVGEEGRVGAAHACQGLVPGPY